jgi:cell division transport system ATP-binding protein
MIQLFHVSRVFPGDYAALSDVSLTVGRGEFAFLTGPSGAGKTTLLNLIFCADQPTQGQVLVDGCNVARLRRSALPGLRRKIGVVFQDFKLLPRSTVAENVAITLQVVGIKGRERQRRVNRVLAQVGLEHRASALPLQLSGGEQQRTAIARALVHDPLLLLADEPTGNLDPVLTIQIMDLLSAANARGVTVLVATHDPALLSRYRKRTLQLERGRLVSDSEGTAVNRRAAQV